MDPVAYIWEGGTEGVMTHGWLFTEYQGLFTPPGQTTSSREVCHFLVSGVPFHLPLDMFSKSHNLLK